MEEGGPQVVIAGFGFDPEEHKDAVFYKGDRMGEAHPVDFVANDRKPGRIS